MKLTTVLVLASTFAPAASLCAADYNGDGFDDLALSAVPDATKMVVQVMFGTAAGLSANGMQTLVAQETPVISYTVSTGFGRAMASGDFDGDGFDDLAVSSYEANFKNIPLVGCVNVFKGSPTGLVFSTVLHQNKGGMKDKCEPGEYFGWSLAVGDFNHDGFADLAAGVFETLGKLETAGAVHVIYGSKKGLTGAKDQLWHQNSKGVNGVAEADDAFGSSLAAGDADGDGFDDLAIGVPFEATDHGGIEVEGAVALLRGSKKGLTAKNDALFDNADVNPSNFDPSGRFGLELAFGDFDGDGKRHLVIGAPAWDWSGPNTNDGAIYLVPITSTSVDFAGHKSFGLAEAGFFGFALQVGNFNGDGYDDLAVGAPDSKFITGVVEAGLTVVMRGGATGLDALGALYVTRNAPDVLGAATAFAAFGLSLAAGDYDADGRSELAIGAPYDTIGASKQCGGINVLRGSSTSVITTTNSQWWFGAPFGATQSFQTLGLNLH